MSADHNPIGRSLFFSLFVAAFALVWLSLFPRCAHGKSLAAVILIDTYDNPNIPGLPKTESDQAREVAKALTAANYDVSLLENPTKAEVENLFFQVLPVKLAKGDTLVIYLTGRGVGGDFGNPYLLPRNTNPDDIEGSGIKVEGLLGLVSQATVIVLTNTTHSGEIDSVAFIGPQSRHFADQVFSSFVLSTVSLNNDMIWSNFGTVVVNGLSHSADISNDGNITLAEFRRYLESQIGLATSDRVRVDVAGNYDPTMVISTAPKAIVLSATPLVVLPKRHQILGWSLLGSGTVLGAGSAVFYAVGQKQLDNLNPNNSSLYETTRALQIGTGVAGGFLAAAGTGVVVFRF